ncbi:DNA-J related domain-containing protein [Thiomicrorhabdus sp. Kp2]|uniref:DNA-J related domain-containing protein n=1 Tax=Thiomicrorhabdus sp. Kp2 TaxID=1123518 RepID=UPI0003F8DE3F|nr:DNA-J related domain-containing protein [Thiomicrorhabdus sp. Kp2]
MSDIPELPPLPERFEALLWELLKTRQSISEYELLRYLSEQGLSDFKPDLDPLTLFRAHFLLFHLLYRIQDQWFFESRGWLSIHTTDIHLQEMAFSPKSVERTPQEVHKDDPVKAYYLDYREFLNTQEEDVLGLLDDFWKKMASHPIYPINEGARLQAQQTLGLENQIVSRQSVKLQFRNLCQQHHPDKGGDAQVFRQICDAKEILLQGLN